MIKISFELNQNQEVKEIRMSGHAQRESEYKEYDLICAAASGITFGILNSLDNKLNDITIKDNLIVIIPKVFQKDNQLILRVLYNSLNGLANDYPKNVKLILRGIKDE